jgi:hypothetical protein
LVKRRQETYRHEIKEEVNETLSKHKRKKYVQIIPDNRPSLPESKVIYCTAELDDITPEEASEEVGDIHYHISKDELNKDNV